MIFTLQENILQMKKLESLAVAGVNRNILMQESIEIKIDVKVEGTDNSESEFYEGPEYFESGSNNVMMKDDIDGENELDVENKEISNKLNKPNTWKMKGEKWTVDEGMGTRILKQENIEVNNEVKVGISENMESEFHEGSEYFEYCSNNVTKDDIYTIYGDRGTMISGWKEGDKLTLVNKYHPGSRDNKEGLNNSNYWDDPGQLLAQNKRKAEEETNDTNNREVKRGRINIVKHLANHPVDDNGALVANIQSSDRSDVVNQTELGVIPGGSDVHTIAPQIKKLKGLSEVFAADHPEVAGTSSIQQDLCGPISGQFVKHDMSAQQWCQLSCRSIRIGNYRVLPKEKITITTKGVQIKVPAIINTSEVVGINIPMSDVVKVLAHFGKKCMPLLFLYISPAACNRARKMLKMTNSQSFFLDVHSTDETQKRITIIPEKVTEDNKQILKQHFGSKVQELERKEANDILVRSSPKNLHMLKSKMGEMSAAGTTEDKKAGEHDGIIAAQSSIQRLSAKSNVEPQEPIFTPTSTHLKCECDDCMYVTKSHMERFKDITWCKCHPCVLQQVSKQEIIGEAICNIYTMSEMNITIY